MSRDFCLERPTEERTVKCSRTLRNSGLTWAQDTKKCLGITVSATYAKQGFVPGTVPSTLGMLAHHNPMK